MIPCEENAENGTMSWSRDEEMTQGLFGWHKLRAWHWWDIYSVWVYDYDSRRSTSVVSKIHKPNLTAPASRPQLMPELRGRGWPCSLSQLEMYVKWRLMLGSKHLGQRNNTRKTFCLTLSIFMCNLLHEEYGTWDSNTPCLQFLCSNPILCWW